MKLRHKFGALALLYAVSLTANLILSLWFISLFHEHFLAEMTGASTQLGIAAMEIPGEIAPSGPAPEWRAVLQRQILGTLGVYTLGSAGLAILGLLLVHRWVVRPIVALQTAAVEIGKGNFAHRVEVASGDELGTLSAEVNAMASSVAAMQAEVLERERQRASAEALRHVIHNVRSPLTGIRWLAEAIGMRRDIDAQTAAEQGQIVTRVDQVLSWLQGFRESVAAASTPMRIGSLSELLAGVLVTCRLLAERKGITIQERIASDLPRMPMESSQLSAALQVLLSQAVNRAQPGGLVRVVVSAGESPQNCELTIDWQDRDDLASAALQAGPSIVGELVMAEMVIRLHRGSIERSLANRKARVVIALPV